MNRDERLKSDLAAMQALKEGQHDSRIRNDRRYLPTAIRSSFAARASPPTLLSRGEVEANRLAPLRRAFAVFLSTAAARRALADAHISSQYFLQRVSQPAGNRRDLGDKTWAWRCLSERLWDVARGAYINLDKSANYAARNWFADSSTTTIVLPVDRRPLRDKIRTG